MRIRIGAARERLTVGLDLGDRQCRYCVLGEQGDVLIEDTLPTTKTGLNRLFERMPPSRVVLEVGAHSPWVSRHLARLGRIDPQLLAPIRHRSEQAQADLMLIRARRALVEARTKLINAARGLVRQCQFQLMKQQRLIRLG
ncbi:MAG: hypothetical protein AAB225_05015, partial [Acidobacteriota bacterium]